MPRDNGQNIYCFANNIKGESVVSDKITLDVRCKYVKQILIDLVSMLMFKQCIILQKIKQI